MNQTSLKKLLIFLTTATLAISIISCNNKDQNVPITDVKLNQNVTTRAAGDSFTLTATVLPDNATNKQLTWFCSNDTVATVSNGVVTTLVSGRTSIIVTTEEGNKTDTCALVVAIGCNVNTPGWGSSLGIVTRGAQEWAISGNGITQIWSDAVTATNCQKTTFAGGSTGNFSADCRSNPDYPGDLFSWCAVIRFQDQLCPDPWRVPTTEDFINLDIAMGGNGRVRNTGTSSVATPQFTTDNYINRWGGALGGACVFEGAHVSDGTLFSQGTAFYWSQTEFYATDAGFLHFRTSGTIWPSSRFFKQYGLSLRCVR